MASSAPTLYLIRGIPGSEKSTFATHLQTLIPDLIVREADQFFQTSTPDGPVYKFDPSLLPSAHAWCLDEADYYMKRGYPLAVVNTFVYRRHLSPYLTLAETYGYQVFILTSGHTFPSIHGVPLSTISRMASHFEL